MKPEDKNKGGRPKGALSKIAQASREAAKATGLLPHEILLSMARGEPQANHVIDPATGKVQAEGWLLMDLDQRRAAAQAAAPYFAPKISTVEVISGVADHELDRIIAQLAAEAGIGPSPSGEGTQDEEEEPAAATTRRRLRVE